MNFTDIFIRKPVLATTISLLILVLGFVITCYLQLWTRFKQEIRAGNAYQRLGETKQAE